MSTLRLWRRALGVVLLFMSSAAFALDLTGAGASLPYPVYAKWAASFYEETGHKVNYQSMGSGGGQQQIVIGTVDFGASDDPVSEDWLQKHNLIQFPAVAGGIVPIVNVPGITAGDLRLTPEVLADIYLGAIRRWNDEAIKALNPGLSLPDAEIVVVYRSDGSGTTYVWTDYLASATEQWAQQVGRGKAVKWPVGQGGKGNEGVAAYVQQLTYAIGYIEYSYAIQNQLAWVQLMNRAGYFVAPGQRTFRAAMEQADWQVPGMAVNLTNQPGAHAWPLTAASFILLRRSATSVERRRVVLEFFDWALTHGSQVVRDLGYIPIPAFAVNVLHEQWSQTLHDEAGKPVWDP